MSNRLLIQDPPAPVRIFVSSTYFDLKSIRQELTEFLANLGFEPVVFETAGAIPNIPAADSALQHAAQADICILIVGTKCGSKSMQSEISYTHAEYRTAMDMGRPIFAFVERETLVKFDLFMSRGGTEFWTSEEHDLFNFLHEVSSQGSRFPFDTLPELKQALRYQLASYFGYLVRQYSVLDSFSPSSSDAWHVIGNQLWNRGQLGAGIYCFRRTLEIDEFHQYGLEKLARALRMTGRAIEAIPLCKKGIGAYPNLSVYRRELSLSLLEVGKKEEAISEAEKAVTDFPKDSRVWATLSAVYRREDRLKDAAKAAKKAYELNPSKPKRRNRFLDFSGFLELDDDQESPS